MANEVLVFIETKEQKPKKVALEILSLGRRVADQLNVQLTCVLLGHNIGGVASSLGEYGADRVYLADDEKLAQYTTCAYSKVISDLISEKKPELVLMGYTVIGRDLAPRLAERFQAGLFSDCTALDLDANELIFTRPIYAGKAFVRAAAKGAPVLATIRPNVFAGQTVAGHKADVEEIPVNVNPGDVRQLVKDLLLAVSSRPELTEADVIVSGGRGMKGPENFSLLEKLADTLGAAVGASRAAVDAGWIEQRFQVGQTGKTVSPVLYIACGISGAIQHLAGMGSSKCIVAINKDPEANIFKVADYGIVGDLFEIVPFLTAACRELKA